MDQQKTGKFIAELRKQKGMNQEQLGEYLGVTNKTVSRWETGKYMPDIDKLQDLSAVLDVSINELLAGERIGDAAIFRKQADENIVKVLAQPSAFGLQDRIDYFKRKWLRDHRGLIALWALALLVLCVFVWLRRQPVLAALIPVAGLAVYAHLRNQMMIYVEDRAFVPDDPNA